MSSRRRAQPYVLGQRGAESQNQQGQASRLNQTVVPAPAVSCRAASPLTTATSTQPELPINAINEPVGRSSVSAQDSDDSLAGDLNLPRARRASAQVIGVDICDQVAKRVAKDHLADETLRVGRRAQSSGS